MPPRRLSRYLFSDGFKNEDGDFILTDPTPYRFKDFSDNIIYTTKHGDTLFAIADLHFKGVPRPSGLWWIIADFQPDPIHDPTIRFENGIQIVIPSLRTVVEEIFNERRRDEEE